MKLFTVIDSLSSSLFYKLSKLRHARIFHPRGALHKGTLTIADTANLPACLLFTKPTTYPIVARLSRGIGLPLLFPDILGFALRIPDVYGPNLHQDILMVTSGKGKILRYAMLFKYNFSSSFFSTILLYKISDKKYLFGIIPSKEGTGENKAFTLAIASPFGQWQSVGKIQLEEILPKEESIKIRYNPWNTGDEIQPYGFLQRLRKHVYIASQEGRSKKEGDFI